MHRVRLLRAAPLAAASTIASLSAPSTPPAECLFGFGKSKKVIALEEKLSRLTSEREAALAEKAAAEKERDDALAKKTLRQQAYDESLKLGSAIAQAGQTGIPQDLSYAFVAGCVSGYAAKKAGKLIAVVAGGVYGGLMFLDYNGLIKVNHNEIEARLLAHVDLNHDGKVDAKDLDLAWDKSIEILTYGVPKVGGFASGFAMGLSRG